MSVRYNRLPRKRVLMRYLLPWYRPMEFADLDPPIYFHLPGMPSGALARVLYGSIACNYELVVLERVVEIPFVFQHLGVGRGARILDFGCTGSMLSLHLASLGYEVTGVDFRPYPFTHRNLRFIAGNFLTADVPDEAFDVAIAVSAIEHTGLGFYREDTYDEGDRRVVEEIRRTLRPGGRLLITVPYGRAGRTSWYRVYDEQSLRRLLASFCVAKTEYYMTLDRREWMPVDEPTVAALDSVECGYARGVACVVAER